MADLTYIIDDDPVAAFVAELLLKKEGISHNVQVFVDGEHAFESIRLALSTGADLPDFVLLDLNMPMMDGWDFLDAFADLGIGTNVPVFVLTSSIHPDDLQRAQRYHQVRGYFTKPLNEQAVHHMQQLRSSGAPSPN